MAVTATVVLLLHHLLLLVMKLIEMEGEKVVREGTHSLIFGHFVILRPVAMALVQLQLLQVVVMKTTFITRWIIQGGLLITSGGCVLC